MERYLSSSTLITTYLRVLCRLNHAVEKTPFLFDQFGRTAIFNKFSIVEHEKHIAVHDGVDPVRYDQDRLLALRDQRTQGVLDQSIRHLVHIGRRLVQNQDLRVGKQSPMTRLLDSKIWTRAYTWPGRGAGVVRHSDCCRTLQ